MAKTFYLFTVGDQGTMTACEALPKFEGTIVDARKVIGSEGFPAGQYRILEDTSGIITKTVASAPKTTITFDTPRKRPRQPKPEGATEPKPKKGGKK